MSGAPAQRSRRIPFEPGLEGLRGLALLGMLCFHQRFSWAAGGFLPLATFFTLSGYLITSLFLAEWHASGRIDLRRFWARRFRRLMPAALLTLACMPLYGLLLATPDQAQRLQDDVLWALVYVANWHFWLTDAAYQELFTAPSPVLHFWSLSIEEQFYFVFPLIAGAGLWLGSGSRRVFGAILALLVLGCVGLSIALVDGGASVDRIYYGSDTRAPELLLGGLLALVICGRPIEDPGRRRLVVWLGVVSLVAMLWMWTRVQISELWLYRGGFAAYSLLTLGVIAAAVQPEGPVRRILSWPTLQWVGRVSYGAYLFHWPIYLWLSSERTGLEGMPLFVLRVALSLSLAGLSYRWLESPIRSGAALVGWRPWVVTPAAFAAVALTITAVQPPPRDHYVYRDFDPETVFQELFAKSVEIDKTLPDPDAPTLFNAKPRVAVFGDSTAFMLSLGLSTWLWKEDLGRLRPGVAQLGCGLLEEGEYISHGRQLQRASHCHTREFWRAAIARGQADVAVVLAGPWDVADRKLPGDDAWRHPGDPVLDAYLREEMLGTVDLLSERGTLVVWLTHPRIERRAWDDTMPDEPFPVSDPARMRRFNELIHELPRLRPGKVRVIDLAAYMRTLPGGELDETYRPDGVHLSRSASMRLANEWLGPELLRVYRDEARRVRAALESDPSTATPPVGTAAEPVSDTGAPRAPSTAAP